MCEQVYNSFADRKRSWPAGAWDGEADKRVWMDAATGLVCMHRRCGDGGYLCGYVGVEPWHPLFGWSHRAIPAGLGVTAHRGLDESGPCSHGLEAEAMCHVAEPGRSAEVWWLGFKCDRDGDLLPQEGRGRGREFRGEEYRGVDYVVSECRNLARALAALATPEPDQVLALPAPTALAGAVPTRGRVAA